MADTAFSHQMPQLRVHYRPTAFELVKGTGERVRVVVDAFSERSVVARPQTDRKSIRPLAAPRDISF